MSIVANVFSSIIAVGDSPKHFKQNSKTRTAVYERRLFSIITFALKDRGAIYHQNGADYSNSPKNPSNFF